MYEDTLTKAEVAVDRYVMGFLFSEDLENVVLITKDHPDWMKGKRNGVGGKIQPGEEPLHAMIREFGEEAGLYINKWVEFALLRGHGFQVQIYHAVEPLKVIQAARTMTNEKIAVVKLVEFGTPDVPGSAEPNYLANLKWLILMSLSILNKKESASYFEIIEHKPLPVAQVVPAPKL
jgi:8-oxo-dGTP diphosphatase